MRYNDANTVTLFLRLACRYFTASVRRTALGADGSSTGKIDETTTTTPATPPSASKGGSSRPGGDGASTTPLGKRAEEGVAGGDAEEGGPEAPSPTKARKGSR